MGVQNYWLNLQVLHYEPRIFFKWYLHHEYIRNEISIFAIILKKVEVRDETENNP